MSFDKEKRKAEYELFYISKGINKTALLRENETEKGANNGYKCVCCYCLNNIPDFDCSHICCRTGTPSNFYLQNEELINKDKLLT